MRIGPKRAQRTETTVDDGLGEVPEGGFAPLADAAGAVATYDDAMPPPPGEIARVHGASEQADDSVHGDGPTTSFPPSLLPTSPAAATPQPPPDNWAAPIQEPREAVGRDGSVVFFGSGERSTTPSSWIPEDDEELIAPIEPARLITNDRFARENGATSLIGMNDATSVSSDGDAVEAEMITWLAAARVMRGFLRPVTRIQSFLDDDDAMYTTFTPVDGSVVLLAGSELAGVVTIAPPDPHGFSGISIELSPPEHVPLGIRVPIAMVTSEAAGATSAVSVLGGLTITAVDGALDLSITLDGRVVRRIVDEVSRALTSLAAAANRHLESQGRVFKDIAVDSLGSLRVEAKRR